MLDVFAALTADDPPVPAGDERHHVLWQPTFHADVLLTLDLGAAATIRLRHFTCSVSGLLHEHRLAAR